MTKQDRLGGMLQEVEQPLSAALRRADVFTNWLDEELQLTFPHCGLASLALQIYFQENGINSQRQIAQLRGAAALSNGGPSHVMLRVGDQVVDPPYCQFFALVGFDSTTANHFPELRQRLPEQKIARFNVHESVRFGRVIGRRALVMRDVLSSGDYALPAALTYPGAPRPPLEAAGDRQVVASYRSIWQANYVDLDTADSHVLQVAHSLVDEMV